jgi:hypothetical protein
MVRPSEILRWIALFFAAGTMIGGVIGLCFGGSKWPTVIGAVACCVLGEIWRWQGRREHERLVARVRAKR